MTEKRCEVCTQRVKPHTSREGTSFYEPVAEAEVSKLRVQLGVAVEGLEKYLNYNQGSLREMADIMTHPSTIAAEALAEIEKIAEGEKHGN